MKTCKTCGETKALDQFHKDRSKSDGLNLYCKPCTITKQKHLHETAISRPSKGDAKDGLKRCPTCDSTKPVSEFGAHTKRYDGLQPSCKDCTRARGKAFLAKNPGYGAEKQKEWREANPRLAKDFKLRIRYGIPLGSYDKMLKEQDGKCALCSTEDPGGAGDFHVDHCHDTGVVRSLLCANCNVGIGHFFHRVDLLKLAIGYVTKHQPKVAV